MPFVSKAQAKWAFATKQPWAREWGHKTRLAGGIAKLPQYVVRKNRKGGNRKVVTNKEVPSSTPAVGNASGPGGLFSSSGLEKANTSTITRRPHRIRAERRTRPEITYKDGEGHSGGMIALFLSPIAASTVGAAAARMFGDKAEDPCELHITLAYLGKIADSGFQEKLPHLMQSVQKYVQTWHEMVGIPLIGVLRGYNCFENAQDDGSIPIYRVVDSPLLMMWVDGLKKVLDEVGIDTHRDHDVYTPHVTVAYSYPELAQIVKVAPAAVTPVQFGRVTIALGDVQIDLPLATEMYKAVPSRASGGHVVQPKVSKPTVAAAGGSSAGPGQIAPGVYRIHGNLCQVHGKFGPCDGATSEGFDKKPKKAKSGKGKGGKGGKGAKPKLTADEKKAQRAADKAAQAQEAEAQRQQNRATSLAALASRPNDQAMQVLDTLRTGGQPDGAMLKSMESTGLLEKHSDGSYTLSANGHGLLNALDKGDAGAASEALAKGKDTVANATSRAQAQSERQSARAQAIAERNAAKIEQQKKYQQRDAARQKRAVARGGGSGSGSRKPTKRGKKHTPKVNAEAQAALDRIKAARAAQSTPAPKATVAMPTPTKPAGSTGSATTTPVKPTVAVPATPAPSPAIRTRPTAGKPGTVIDRKRPLK